MAKSPKNVITVDPAMIMDRYLHYKERHQGWNIFLYIYWAIYLAIESFFLIYYTSIGFTVPIFFGFSLLLLAVMIAVFGMAKALHDKLMRRYG